MYNKYHFSLHLQFKDDCNVDELEKEIGLLAYRKNMLKDSKGKNKTAKLWFKTKNFDAPDTYNIIDKFLKKLEPKFEIIKKANDKYNGYTVFTLYFDELHEKPCISLSKENIELLARYGFAFDTDFRI